MEITAKIKAHNLAFYRSQESVLFMILGVLDICFDDYKSKEYELYSFISERVMSGDIKCPDCGNNMGMHGTYKRKVIISDIDLQTVSIIQVRCKNCKKVHALIPSFLFPYKQYDSETIKKAIDGKAFEIYSADDSTIRRWRALKKG